MEDSKLGAKYQIRLASAEWEKITQSTFSSTTGSILGRSLNNSRIHLEPSGHERDVIEEFLKKVSA
jgi:hypothetical protein